MDDKAFVAMQESIVNELTDTINLLDEGDIKKARKKLQGLLVELIGDIVISKAKELDS